MCNVLPSREAPLAARPRKVIVANVIAAPFQQRRFDGKLQRVAHTWQVAIKELILQRLGAGGDDDFAAGQKGGHEVRKRFASARTCFGNQLRVFCNRVAYGFRQFQLLAASPKIWQCLGELAIGAENAFEVRLHPIILGGGMPARC